MSAEQLWDLVLVRARQTYPAYIVTLWLELPITPIEIAADGGLVLRIDYRHFGWIRKRYGQWIADAVREAGASAVHLEREAAAA